MVNSFKSGTDGHYSESNDGDFEFQLLDGRFGAKRIKSGLPNRNWICSIQMKTHFFRQTPHLSVDLLAQMGDSGTVNLLCQWVLTIGAVRDVR
jgi:hypothetical protein